MQLDKVIIRTVLHTLAAIGVLFVIMICALCFIYPATMMEITFDLGMEKASIRNARRAYKYTDDLYFMAYATETAILIDDNKKIVQCGEELLTEENYNNFMAYSATKKENYEQYICAQVSLAKYYSGDKQGAVDTAFMLIEKENNFPTNNAAAALWVETLVNNDSAWSEVIKGKMLQLHTNENLSEADRIFLAEMLGLENVERGNG